MMSPLPFPEFIEKFTLYKVLLVLTHIQGKSDTVNNHNRAKGQPGDKEKSQKSVLAIIQFTWVNSQDPAFQTWGHFS